MAHRREVIRNDEIYLASVNPDTGAVLREGRFKIMGGVSPALRGLAPPIIAIGEQGRDTQPFASTFIFDDGSSGIGVYHHDPQRHVNRVWWSTNDLRRAKQITLPRRKVERTAPGGVGTRQPRAGGVFQDNVWVAWDDQLFKWTEAAGWSALQRTTTGNSTPQSNPVEWEGGWFWPLGTNGIDLWNGAAWVNVAKSCVALVVYVNVLYGVASNGQVFSTNITAASANTKIAGGTFTAADFTDRVKVSDTPTGFVLYPTPDSSADVVPYLLGQRGLYQIDPTTYGVFPVGPFFPPYRVPIRGELFGADKNLYVAQGMQVAQWNTEVSTPVGLNLDDGVPVEYRGSIVALANAGLELFALIDATETSSTVRELYGSIETDDGVLDTPTGYSWLAGWEGGGWLPRAVGDTSGVAGTMLFISAAENTWRVWFSWDSKCFTLDLEQGGFNPLDDANADWEASGTTHLPLIDLGYLEHKKLGLLVEMRTKRCTSTEKVLPYIDYDGAGSFYPLYNADGTGHGITTNGRHSFLLAANPDPATSNPLVFDDDPPAGHVHETAQLRVDLQRGSTVTLTPVVEFIGFHAIKRQAALEAFTLTLDMSDQYNGLSPFEQHELVRALIDDSENALLHFSFQRKSDGEIDTRAVIPVAYSGRDYPGLPAEDRGRFTLVLSEVTIRA